MALRNKMMRILAAVLAVAAVLSFTAAAYAAEGDEFDFDAEFIFKVDDDPNVVSVDVINFKARLNELGFYTAGASDAVLQSKELDDLTMAAVMQVCRLNPEFTYYEDGVTYSLYWRVMGETEGPLVTPEGGEYADLLPGAEGEAVTRVQNRLNQLGYDAVSDGLTPGVYDGALQDVIDEFVRCNKLVYEDGEGITAELQSVLFGDDAAAYSSALSFSGRVLSYVKGSSEISGVSLPNALVLLIAFALICVIVVLIIKLTAKSTPEGTVENRSLYLIIILIPVAAILLLLALASLLYLLLGIAILLVSLVILKRQKPELFARKKKNVLLDTSGKPVPPPVQPAKRTYLILAEQGAVEGQRIMVDRPVYTIGREVHNDFKLNDPRIGRRHLRIEYHQDEDACYAVDLGSVNGTYLNSTRMTAEQPYRLVQGDRLTINDRPFEVEYAYY